MIDPQPVTLEGRHVRLVPMQREHLPAFIRIGLGHDIFRWFPWTVTTPDEMRAFIDYLLDGQAKGINVPFTTVEKASGAIVGATSFLAIDRANRRLEIGATWLGVPWQRTVCNTEAKLLQLGHCFEDLGCVRVEFKTDSLNARSRAALLRIGAVEEGTFRNHMICPGGRVRHSVYFSIIAEEWPRVKRRLIEKTGTVLTS
jgi:RimJ/RimL family protein N-acetyltransferase